MRKSWDIICGMIGRNLTEKPDSCQGRWSRRSVSNRRPAVYKTAALPLSYAGMGVPHGGQRRVRTFEGVSQEIYSLPRLTTSVSAHHLEPLTGIEPVTSSLPWMCSTN